MLCCFAAFYTFFVRFDVNKWTLDSQNTGVLSLSLSLSQQQGCVVSLTNVTFNKRKFYRWSVDLLFEKRWEFSCR